MKKNTKLSIRELSKSNAKYDSKKAPQYCPWTPKFYCPLSPEIPWHKGLVYKDCPVGEDQRDMAHCADCHLRGENTFKLIKKAERKKRSYKKNKKK